MQPNTFLQFDVILVNKGISKLHKKIHKHIFNYGHPYLCAYWHKNRRVYLIVYYTH